MLHRSGQCGKDLKSSQTWIFHKNRLYKGFHNIGVPLVIIPISDWDFPWNKPSSDFLGIPYFFVETSKYQTKFVSQPDTFFSDLPKRRMFTFFWTFQPPGVLVRKGINILAFTCFCSTEFIFLLVLNVGNRWMNVNDIYEASSHSPISPCIIITINQIIVLSNSEFWITNPKVTQWWFTTLDPHEPRADSVNGLSQLGIHIEEYELLPLWKIMGM